MSLGPHYTETQTLQSAAGATGNGTPLNVSGMSVAGVHLRGTFSATVTWEGSIDGTNWSSIRAMNMGDGVVAATATTAGLYLLSVAGLSLIRARISAFTSGNVTVEGQASAMVGLFLG